MSRQEDEIIRLLQEIRDAVVDEDSEPECGVNGCSRTVDAEDATCWQH